MSSPPPYPEECEDALNQVVAYQLHISHVYMGMAYQFMVNKRLPAFAKFFETQADTRREHVEQFIKCLRKRNGKIYPPIHKKPDMKEIITPIMAINVAQEMETTLTKILLHLKDTADTHHESALLNFLTSFIEQQTTNEDYLKYQLTYQERAERRKQKKAPTEKASTSSGEGSKEAS